MLALRGDLGSVSSMTSVVVEMALRERKGRLEVCRKLGNWVSEEGEQTRSAF